MGGAGLELLIPPGYAAVMVVCAWGLTAMTDLPTWAAIVLGCVGGPGARGRYDWFIRRIDSAKELDSRTSTNSSKSSFLPGTSVGLASS